MKKNDLNNCLLNRLDRVIAPSGRMLTVDEVARVFCVPEDTVQAWEERGALPATRTNTINRYKLADVGYLVLSRISSPGLTDEEFGEHAANDKHVEGLQVQP